MRIFSRKDLNLKDFSLKTYSIQLPFDRLKLGVDNVRYDVLISPEFRKTAETFILELIIKHSEASPQFIINPDFNWVKEIAEFKRQCADILTDGIHKAKSLREIQVDFLVQTALVKALTVQIKLQFEEAIQHFKTIIRKYEIAQQVEETLKSRKKSRGSFIGNIRY